MKRCPTCDQSYRLESLQFCRFDGTRLLDAAWHEAPTLSLPHDQISNPETGPLRPARDYQSPSVKIRG